MPSEVCDVSIKLMRFCREWATVRHERTEEWQSMFQRAMREQNRSLARADLDGTELAESAAYLMSRPPSAMLEIRQELLRYPHQIIEGISFRRRFTLWAYYIAHVSLQVRGTFAKAKKILLELTITSKSSIALSSQEEAHR